MSTPSGAAPAGFRDITGQLTTGVFSNRADVPAQGTSIVIKRPSRAGLGREYYSVEYWRVGKPVRVKGGWTTNLALYRGYSWQREVTSRLDRVASDVWRMGEPAARVFIKR